MDAILSVVRFKKPRRRVFEESTYCSDRFYTSYPEEARRKMWEESEKAWDRLDGKYDASGGAKATDDLQKAQVYGFSKRAQKSLAGYRASGRHEVIPVLLVPEEEMKWLRAKIQILINSMDLPDGTYTFPDGDTWEQTKPGAES